MIKRESRVRMDLSVRVWGADSNGKAFETQARTVNITPVGARIAGIRSPLQRGCIINVACGRSQAQFRVTWIGRQGTECAGHVGVRCVEHGKCIWDVALKRGMDRGPGFNRAIS